MESKCKILFSGPPKDTSLCETTSFDVLIVKIGVSAMAVGGRKYKKKLVESLCMRGSGVGAGTKKPLSDRNEILYSGSGPRSGP